MESDRAMLWTVAVAASLGLHVLVIVALLGFGAIAGGSGPEPLPKPAIAAESDAAADRFQGDAAVSGEPQTATGSNESRMPPGTDSTASEEVADHKPAASDENGEKYYVVKAGDNLSKIAKLDDSTLAELAELNGKSIKELSKLMIGQKIRVKNGIK